MKPKHLKSPTKASLRHQRGVTLIELTIGIAIIVAVYLAGMKLVPAVKRMVNVYSETQSITTLIGNASNLYQGRYANLTTAKAIQYNLAPADLVNGNALAGHWGPITLAPSAITGAAANTAQQVTLANIPQADCAMLAPSLLGIAVEMDVGGSANLKSANNPNPARDTITDACGTSDAVNIVIRATQ